MQRKNGLRRSVGRGSMDDRMHYFQQWRQPTARFGKTLAQQVEVSLTMFFIVCVFLILLLSLTFLLISNKSATKGYELQLLQQQRSALVEENEVLAMRITQYEALSTLNRQMKSSVMVAAPPPTVIAVDRGIVAKR